MIVRIVSILDRNHRLSFATFCSTCTQQQEVVVAFLALLTLLRRRIVIADQRELFGPISVTRSSSEIRHMTANETQT
jgi:chromatin segregation and condensation protein Rec8/ScpA/Scc1 (kleisin family)